MIVGAPPPTTDELRLRQLDDAIAVIRREERAEIALRAEEDRRRAEFDSRCGQLEKLEQRRAELSARITEQQTHLRVTAEEELKRVRAARLDDEIRAIRSRLESAESERAGLSIHGNSGQSQPRDLQL